MTMTDPAKRPGPADEARHCRRDNPGGTRNCSGSDYCACQCDACFWAWAGRPRTDEERATLEGGK